MSHRFHKPKQHPNEGSLKARLRRSAEMIQTQEQLDRILAQADPVLGRAWLDQVRPFLKFQPLQFRSEPIKSLQTTPT